MNIRNIGCLVLMLSCMGNGVLVADDNGFMTTERSFAQVGAQLVPIMACVGGTLFGLGELILGVLTRNKTQYIKQAVVEEAKFGAKAGATLSVVSLAIGYSCLKAQDFLKAAEKRAELKQEINKRNQ
jgi:hypothetical protein